MAKLVEGYATRIEVPAGKRDIQVFDDALPGFGIRKFATGRAVYIVKYSVGSQQRKLSLGPVVPGVLADKRRLASQILSRARLGQDAVGEKRATIAKATAKIGDLIVRYLGDRKDNLRPRYFAEIERQLKRDWGPLHGAGVDVIGRQDVVRIVDQISTGQGPVAADRARVALSGFYGWCIDRGHCDLNPTLNIKARADTRSRERVLAEAELIEIWNSCREDDYGRILRLLILTGQRRQEIGDLAWSEINVDKKQIELPGARTKNGQPHIISLSDQATAVLLSNPQREGRDFVFGRGQGGFSGWSRAKADLDARIAAARERAGSRATMAPWVLHDLRRAFVTHINETGIATPHVAEAIVNHVSGHLGGIAGVYNKAKYNEERRQALNAWAAYITQLVTKTAEPAVISQNVE